MLFGFSLLSLCDRLIEYRRISRIIHVLSAHTLLFGFSLLSPCDRIIEYRRISRIIKGGLQSHVLPSSEEHCPCLLQSSSAHGCCLLLSVSELRTLFGSRFGHIIRNIRIYLVLLWGPFIWLRVPRQHKEHQKIEECAKERSTTYGIWAGSNLYTKSCNISGKGFQRSFLVHQDTLLGQKHLFANQT
nr:unnamed protein product [Fasciola hepatica]